MPKRVQLELSDDAYETIRRLKEELDLPSMANVLRDGLAVLDWAVEEAKEGKEVMLVSEKGDRRKEAVLTFLSRVRKRYGRKK